MNENNYTETNLQEIEAQIAQLQLQRDMIAQQLLETKAKDEFGDIYGSLYRFRNNDGSVPAVFEVFTKVKEEKSNGEFTFEAMKLTYSGCKIVVEMINVTFSDKDDLYNRFDLEPNMNNNIKEIANAFKSLIH